VVLAKRSLRSQEGSELLSGDLKQFPLLAHLIFSFECDLTINNYVLLGYNIYLVIRTAILAMR